jgi:hypothetical protein
LTGEGIRKELLEGFSFHTPKSDLLDTAARAMNDEPSAPKGRLRRFAQRAASAFTPQGLIYWVRIASRAKACLPERNGP